MLKNLMLAFLCLALTATVCEAGLFGRWKSNRLDRRADRQGRRSERLAEKSGWNYAKAGAVHSRRGHHTMGHQASHGSAGSDSYTTHTTTTTTMVPMESPSLGSFGSNSYQVPAAPADCPDCVQ